MRYRDPFHDFLCFQWREQGCIHVLHLDRFYAPIEFWKPQSALAPSPKQPQRAADARLRSPTRKDKRGVDLISDVLPFGRLWYNGPNAAANAIGYGMHYS